MYYPLHFWYDSTKQHLADARHRLVFHNLAGVALSIKMFGDFLTYEMEDKAIVTADNYFLGVQHINEDFGRTIGAEEILEFCTYHTRDVIKKFNNERALDTLIKKHKGIRSDYKPIVDFFSHYTGWTRDPDQTAIAYAFLCNSFGIFQLEKLLGTLFTRESDKRVIPTRILGENYINGGYGQIPTLNQILDKVPQRSWMQVNAAALSFQFDENQSADPKAKYLEQHVTPFPLPLK
jgi:hypothetical protein